MSIGCGTGIPTDVAILSLKRFDSFRELYLLCRSSVFGMVPLDYCRVTFDTMLGGCERKTTDVHLSTGY